MTQIPNFDTAISNTINLTDANIAVTNSQTLPDTNQQGELEEAGVPAVIDMKDLTLIHNSTTHSE